MQELLINHIDYTELWLDLTNEETTVSYWTGKRWQTRTSTSESKACRVLAKSASVIGMIDMFRDHPNYFDIINLTNPEKSTLLLSDYNLFKDHIDIDAMSVTSRVDMFINAPTKFKEHLPVDKLTGTQLTQIATHRPSYFKKYNLPTDRVTRKGWNKLLSYNSAAFQTKFLQAMRTIRCKTTVRSIFKKYPKMLQCLTIEQINESSLSSKEWVLLLNWDEVRARNITYDTEVTNWLREELTMELLSGSASKTRQLKAALELL